MEKSELAEVGKIIRLLTKDCFKNVVISVLIKMSAWQVSLNAHCSKRKRKKKAMDKNK